jgi:hypothetical protein
VGLMVTMANQNLWANLPLQSFSQLEHKMAKQKIEIDVPAGYEATGEYRCAKVGEWYFDCCSNAVECKQYTTCGQYPILRKVWELPKWFTPKWYLYKNCHTEAWMVTDEHPNGNSFGYSHKWGFSMDAKALWAFHGETWVEPPTGLQLTSRLY